LICHVVLLRSYGHYGTFALCGTRYWTVGTPAAVWCGILPSERSDENLRPMIPALFFPRQKLQRHVCLGARPAAAVPTRTVYWASSLTVSTGREVFWEPTWLVTWLSFPFFLFFLFSYVAFLLLLFCFVFILFIFIIL
jgi:hypothetical protein